MSKKHKTNWLIPAVMVIALALVCAAVVALLTMPETEQGKPAVSTAPTATVPGSTGENDAHSVRVDTLEEVSIEIGHGMVITDVGSYTGVYMEDGSDEIVSGIMMIAVTNEGEDTIQYAEISLPVGDETARFSLSTLPPGETVILLELDRMEYVPGTYTTAVAENVALFSAPLDLCEDRLKLQILDGAINVINISGGDIAGDIVIYYKNSAADVYYGGITYRVRLAGGLKADEVRQIMASHFSASGSTILFVTCGES